MRKQPKKKNTPPKEKGNVFDKILKENIKTMIKPLAEELLKAPIKSIKPLPTKMQTTLEIESDDFNLVEMMDGKKIILHLEFEIRPTKNMVYRIGEYHAVNQRKYELPIKHFLIDLCKEKIPIRTQLRPEEIYKGFTHVRIYDQPAEQYIASDIPEIVIMAVLGGFADNRKNEIVQAIIMRLQALVNDKRKMKKYIDQLFMFGRIRNLGNILTKNFEDMTSFNYDITKDGLYLRGVQKEKKKAEKEKIQAIKKMLLDSFYSQKQIAEILNVSTYFVRKIKKELDSEN